MLSFVDPRVLWLKVLEWMPEGPFGRSHPPVLESLVCLYSSLHTEDHLPDTIYDVAIIGSGPAGYTAAIRAGQYGLKTALIEKDGFLGGTCLHVGCIPTKALLFNAELWDHLKEAKEFGIEGVDARKLNWAAIQDRKAKIVAKHTKGLEFLMKKNKVETVNGYGKLTGPAQNGISHRRSHRRQQVNATQGQERDSRHRLGSAHAPWPRGRTTAS